MKKTLLITACTVLMSMSAAKAVSYAHYVCPGALDIKIDTKTYTATGKGIGPGNKIYVGNLPHDRDYKGAKVGALESVSVTPGEKQNTPTDFDIHCTYPIILKKGEPTIMVTLANPLTAAKYKMCEVKGRKPDHQSSSKATWICHTHNDCEPIECTE